MASCTSSPTTFSDLQLHILQTHILPRLDGLSLSSAAATSSYLRSLSADHDLWAHICNSTWPSINHPCLHDVISTFPAAHRSFFHDSFPAALITTIQGRIYVEPRFPSATFNHPDSSPHPLPSELISAIDIRYHNDVIFSRLEFTHTTPDFLSSTLRIVLNNSTARAGTSSKSIDLKISELVDADDETIAELKESMTLSWIVIDPTVKRAGNLSSIKPVLAWITNDTIHLRYVTVLPQNELNEMVECRIEVALAVGKGEVVSVNVSEVKLYIQDIACNCLSGKEFLVIMRRAILEKDRTRRKVVGDGDVVKLVGLKLEEDNQRVAYINLPLLSFLLLLYIILLLF
ncbi:hypothetical protein OSB04_025204 [Centaurea solstitialis]|uniref:F-box protein n=1 Tax=Centaurea solstitialis TaxID=347529 RepID=A0AA38W1H2_9ASTR|nr:hypothetical protein OSB04_025204 [Centaurea solstitialis]